MAVKEAALGDKHASIDITLKSIEVVHQKLGNLRWTLEYHEKALAVEEAALGDKHARIGVTLSNFGLFAASVMKASSATKTVKVIA